MAAVIQGQYRLGLRRLVLARTYRGVALHRAPVVQVTMAERGELVVTDGFVERRARAAVIPAGVRHTVATVEADQRVISLHLPGWTSEARALAS